MKTYQFFKFFAVTNNIYLVRRADDISRYQTIIDEAAENGDWLVFYIHSAIASEFDAILT